MCFNQKNLLGCGPKKQGSRQWLDMNRHSAPQHSETQNANVSVGECSQLSKQLEWQTQTTPKGRIKFSALFLNLYLSPFGEVKDHQLDMHICVGLT